MDSDKLISEVIFKAVRSSGAGGQNVNKVSSKVVLTFNINSSEALSDDEKQLISHNLSTRITSENILILKADEDRSQVRNKDIVSKRFIDLISKALIVPKKRKPTKIPRSVIEKRIKEKRSQSEVKQNRRKPDKDMSNEL